MAVLMGLLALGQAGCARWFPHGHGGFDRSLTIVTPRDRLQVPADGTVPVLVRVDRPLTASTLRLALATGGRPPVDLTARLHETPQGFAATLTSTDLVPGLSRLIVSARPSRHDAEEAQHSDTSFASAMLSWEPAVDVSLATRCDFLGQSRCALPFPNDWFTVRDSSAATGRRVHLDAASLPANVAGAHTDPAEWNRNDGFSPGAMILATVPGVDLAASGAPPITDIGRSLAPDSPIVLVDADTGAHWPFFAELDANATSDANRALIIRPARNLLEGHRYIVAMHHLENTSAAALAPSRAFQLYRDRIPTFIPVVEGRRWHMESIFETLHHAGVGRSDLTLAWDFTVASERSLTSRLLHIRDDAFASLHGAAPSFTVTHVDENVDATTLRRVIGTFTVPNYLTGTGQPGSGFNYAPGDTGPDRLPSRNGDYTANFRCLIPRSTSADGNDPVHPARGIANGHGLLGSANEVDGFGPLANEGNSVICGTDEIGMSGSDLGNVAVILGDLSKFPTLADRLQQGILNMQFLGRLLKDPRGFGSAPAFQAGAAHTPVIKSGEVFFNGNSQGGILGGAITAVSTDFTRAVLGVPAINYSTLLNRSVDYTEFSGVSLAAYPDALDQQFDFSLIQMLWDRGEGDGYAQHLTDDPLPGTPRHVVLLIEAFGDHQVANIGTETLARTIGAKVWQPALAPGRSPDVTPFWGIAAVPSIPYRGSVLVMWDYGTPRPPLSNTAPEGPQYGQDPHGFGHDNPGV
ncbi:MAG: hypothetical protein ACXWA9_16155, partial [Acidimicrobiia bacterium]